MPEKKDQILFAIRRIKELSFTLNEQMFQPSPVDKEIKIEFQYNIAFNSKSNLVVFTLRTVYLYPEFVSANNFLCDIHVQNIFEVPNLAAYFINNEFILPKELIISIVSLSISHSRALFCKNIDGTIFQENIIPIINPVEISASFFPSIFRNTEAGSKSQETSNKGGMPKKFIKQK